MLSTQIKKLLEPKSIAIIGASREPNKLGNIIVTNIQSSGFKGEIFPINPNANQINNLTCYPSYSALPEVPDLAIIAVPADVALEAIPAIAQKGTKSLVILSAGFKEIGNEGLKREEKLITLAQEYQLSIVGPNCLGFINNDCNLNATFGQADHTDGNIRFISQSGAIATAIFDWAHNTGVGFSSFVTLGNKTVVGENEILEFYLQHKPTKQKDAQGLSRYHPVGLYLESISQGKKFLELAAQVGRRDPVFVLKPGKSTAAQAAMQSHTGALANDDAVLGAAFESAGIIRCGGLEDFFDIARAFAWENVPEGPRVAIVSNAGGPGVLTTDAVEMAGLQLAPITPKTHAILEKNLPRAANIHNPIDVLGDALADRYKIAMETVLKEKQVDALIVLLTPQIMTQIEDTAQDIVEMSEKYGKPILCSFMGGSAIEIGEQILNKNRIPSFRFPERAIQVLASMWRWRQWQKNAPRSKPLSVGFFALKRKRLKTLLDVEGSLGHSSLPSESAQTFAKIAGIPVAPGDIVSNLDAALSLAHAVEYPVVLKVSSAQALHKTEIKGVITGINNPTTLEQGYGDLEKVIKKLQDPKARISLQKQITGGVEVIAGLKRDPQFGVVLMMGAGGVLAELIADRNLALPPLSEKELENLVLRSKVGKLLQGYRGGKPYAIGKLVKLLHTLTIIGMEFPGIKEIEINPIIVTSKEAFAVDTKIVQAL